MKPYEIWTALLLGLLASSHGAHGKKAGEKMLMSSVRSLTLRSGQMTKGRRVSPIPQLKCVGGSAKGLYEVDVMRCKNMGSDYDDDDSITWACTADLPRYFKLGSTDVFCEGYSNPDDKYILKGSCGVEYRLVLTDAGYEKYGGNSYLHRAVQHGKGWWPTLFTMVFWAVVGLIIYTAWKARNTGADRRAPRLGTGYQRPWFGGGGPGDDPPPPYDPNLQYYGKSTPSGQATSGGWNPGFWGGLATGAAGSYVLNRNRGERDRAPPRSGLWDRESSGAGLSFAESSSAGAARHESTGFGQTRRR